MSTGINEPPSLETKRALVAERLRQNAALADPAPLSFAQQRLWFLDQLEPNSPLYNIGILARLSGTLEIRALEQALNTIVARHEALRTRFVCPNATPQQLIDDQADVGLSFVDLTPLPAREREQESARLIRAEVNRPFNLSSDRLFRARLHRLGPEEHQLVLILHHIVADEWSLSILFRELDVLYRARLAGQPPQLPALPIQYADFAVWQRDWLKGETLEQLLGYWRRQLGGKPPVTELPTDRPRRISPTFRGGQLSRVFDAELKQRLSQLAGDREATLFMVLLSAFNVLLYRYTRQEDLIVGSPIAGRTRIETEPLIGFFVNTVPLRTRLAGDPSFEQLLAHVRETTLAAYAHQDLPFERLVEEVQPERSLGHMPFSKVMFVLQNGSLEALRIADVKVELQQVTSDLAKFEFTLALQESPRGLKAHIEYNRDLFDEDSMARLLGHYETLLHRIVWKPQQRLSQFSLLTPPEQHRLLVEWNDTRTDYPREACVHHVFESQVRLTPNAAAVAFDTQSMTYAELNARANRLAHYLRRFNLAPGSLIGVCLDRSPELVVAFLATLKAGAAYVPLDPEYPKERLGFMLSETGIPVLLTLQSLLPKLPSTHARTICLDRDAAAIALESNENPPRSGGPDDLAYVMYTSGSTGRPKGVAVPHRGILRLVLRTNYIDLDHTDRMAHVSNISFDAATFEIWGALLNGGQLIGFPREQLLSPEVFTRALRQQRITTMFLTSALFNQVAAQAPGAFESLHTLIVGGEALDPRWIRTVLQDRPPRRLLNGYGPTENTTFTCCYHIKDLPEATANVPIGRPISNTEVYILDSDRNPVPIGVPGELYAGGDGLAAGYFGQPTLTAEKFIQHPFRKEGVSKYLYRTGDLARYLPDGNIEFLGRVDQQVKVRGFRIELGEIECVLAQHRGVRECAVVVHRVGSDEKRLVAYFTSCERATPDATELRDFLAGNLPAYMLPSAFVLMAKLPLTPNGKVDRQALAARTPERPSPATRDDMAHDPVEVQLTAIWEKILETRPIGVRDRFFDLGGHSLLAVRVIAEIEKAFGKKLRLATIFQAPTIHQLAAILRDEIKEVSATADSSLVEIQGEGSRPPLFLVHGAGGGMFWGYVNLSRHLGVNQPVYAFKSRGLDGGSESERLEEMAGQYINDLRRLQPHGPYLLGGYCFGGNVAYEMACQLAGQKEPIALLALLNCAPPNSHYTQVRYTPRWALRFLRNLFYWANYCFHWNPRQRREFLRWKWSLLKKRLATCRAETLDGSSRVEAADLVDLSSFSPQQRRVWETHIRALLDFHPKPYAGTVHLFRSPGHPLFCSFDPAYGWGELALGGVEVTVLPGAHEKILEEPCVEVLSRALAQRLELAQRAAVDSAPGMEQSPPQNQPEPNPSAVVYSAPSFSQGDPQEHLAYWTRQFHNPPGLLELPGDRPRPAHLSAVLTRQAVSVRLPSTVDFGTMVPAGPHGTFTLVLSAFVALLHRYSGSQDITIGAVARSGVTDGGGERPANLAPLRFNLGDDPAFSGLCEQARRLTQTAWEHNSIPLDRIVELARANQQNLSCAPLFQVVFSWDETDRNRTGAGDSQNDWPRENRRDPLDLHLHLARGPQELVGWIDYNPQLFDQSRIARMVEHLRMLLAGAIDAPERPISALPLMPEQERTLVLKEWNRTEAAYPSEKTLTDLWLEQVARTPQAEALVSGHERLRYGELYARANRIAGLLSEQGLTRETLIGVFFERSTEMIAAMLGILMAGGAYVPLDPAYPRQRLLAILEDANLRMLLTQEKLRDALPPTQAEVLCVDSIPRQGIAPDDLRRELTATVRRSAPGDLAYVIYTSGSTGKPKGVALEHRGVVAFVSWAQKLFLMEELSGVLASTSICFDLSVFEIFVPLCSGGKVILADNALALPSIPAASEVTLVNTVPSAIKELLRARAVPSSVRVVNLAGEPLATEVVDQIYHETKVQKVYDLYGPTETTTYSTGSLRQAGAPATIGRPLANEQVYLLDQQLQPVPLGIPGELCIGGVGLARGYLNQPELTQEKFIPNPFNADKRLYRTGDLARWRPDGYLEYLGRLDHQVKIRGFRIELGEIESTLRSHPAVNEAVVLAREDHPGDKRLVAYVVARPGQTPTTDMLQTCLQAKLPHYMVPAVFVLLNELPLTPNGKVDRKALPAPQQDLRKPDGPILGPRNPTEEQLLAIWKEVLRLDQLSVSDNFFEIGGHSLLGAQVVARIRDILGVDLPLLTLFNAPTIAALAAGITSGRFASAIAPMPPLQPVPREGPAPVSFVQERLWFLDQLRPGSDGYNVPAALRLRGNLDPTTLQRALACVIQRHEALRTTFRYTDGVLAQVIAPQVQLDYAFEDFAGAGAETEALAWVSGQARRPFDLARGPLIRAGLARLAENEHLFVVAMHHTVCDGWSLALFFEELGALYSSLAAGRGAPSLPEPRLQYIDFAHWQRQTLQGAVLERHLEYWKQTLAGAPETIDLPADFPPGETAQGQAARHHVVLEPALVVQMAELAQRESTTQFTLLMSALALTLHHWTGQSDLILGTVVAGRTRREMESMFGCFMNFLPIRTRISGTETARELLARVCANVLEAQNHQDCPFEKIVECVNPERRLNQNPIYNVALLVQNFPAELFRCENLQATQVTIPMDAALLDLRFEAENTPQGFSLSCEYRKDQFAAATIEHLLSYFVQVIHAMAGSPDARLQDVKLSAPLRAQAAAARNRPGCQTIAMASTFTAEPIAEPLRYWLKELQLDAGIQFAPYNQVFQQLLDPTSLLAANQHGLNVVLLRLEDWQQSPDRSSVPTGGEPDPLERNVREFISGLKAATRRASTPWLICLCPPSRAMLADAQRAQSVHWMEQLLIPELEALNGAYLLTPAELADWYPVAEYDDPRSEELGHVPYTPVFFTALATAVARKFHALSRAPYKVIALDCDQTLWSGVCGEDGTGGLVLDAPRQALQEFMRAQHARGMLLCLCSKNNEPDVLEVFDRRTDMPLRREHFAAWRLNWLPKSANLKSLAQQLQLGLDSFIFLDDNPVECAEVEANCPEVLVLQLPDAPALIPQFLNHCWAFDRLKLTDEDRRRGELYRQNQRRQELLAQSPSLAEFVEGLQLQVQLAPMSAGQISRVAQLTQRTNQFNCTARRLTEAELQGPLTGLELITVQVRDRFGDYGLVGVMMCRSDKRQLSVEAFLLSCRALGRGVEHRMLAHLGEIARARACDWLDVHFARTAKNQPAFEFLENVGSAFRQPLNGGYVFRFPPGFAAEVAFHPVADKPPPVKEPSPDRQSANGSGGRAGRKFARCREIALQANEPVRIHEQVEASVRTSARHRGAYTRPRTDLERQLCELWQNLLRADRVGVQDDFFELGGHSLLAVRLFAEVEKTLGRKLPLVTLFQAPTVAKLASLLQEAESAESGSLLVPIQPRGSSPPLFLVHGAGGDVLWGYANLAAWLPADQPIYGIKSRGQSGLEEFTNLRDMAKCYLQVVREFQPEGPYYLGGYCFGGNVAYEMARQLQAQGQTVALVALIDSAPANAGYETVQWRRRDFPRRFGQNFWHWLQDFAALQFREQRNFVARKLRSLRRRFKWQVARSSSAPWVDLEAVIDTRHFPDHELKLWQIHLQALVEHVEGAYDGQVTLLRTRGQPLFCSLEDDFCWSKLARGGVVVKLVPGSHENIFQEPNVRSLAKQFGDSIASAQARALNLERANRFADPLPYSLTPFEVAKTKDSSLRP